MSTGGQRIKWRRNVAENFNRIISRVHERYRQTTDEQAIAHSVSSRSQKKSGHIFLPFCHNPPYLDSRLAIQDQDQDSAVSRLRPRPRLGSFKTKTKTKTLMFKTKTETKDLQDQYWKSMTGMDCDEQKD